MNLNDCLDEIKSANEDTCLSGFHKPLKELFVYGKRRSSHRASSGRRFRAIRAEFPFIANFPFPGNRPKNDTRISLIFNSLNAGRPIELIILPNVPLYENELSLSIPYSHTGTRSGLSADRRQLEF
jgi:hypothetical protein